MRTIYYMNNSTGEITVDHRTAVNWYAIDNVSLLEYVNGNWIKRLEWIH